MTISTLPGYYSEREQAARLGLALSSLRRWRRQRIGLVSVRVGRRVLYRHGADEEWLSRQQAADERKKGSNGLAPAPPKTATMGGRAGNRCCMSRSSASLRDAFRPHQQAEPPVH